MLGRPGGPPIPDHLLKPDTFQRQEERYKWTIKVGIDISGG